ncbi:MAG: S41 family peptidase, partial [Planctomycetota bacterium]
MAVICLVWFRTIGFGKIMAAENIRDKVAGSQLYRLNTEIEVVLSKNLAVQLDIGDDPYGFEECILYWESAGAFGSVLRMFFFDSDGMLLSRGGSSTSTGEGSLRQVGRLPYLSIATWHIEEDKMRVHFCISSDKDRNQREHEKAMTERESGTRRMSVQLIEPGEVIRLPEVGELDRLGGFMKLWSEVKYNFAFFDRVPELDWDAVLQKYLPKVQNAESIEEYYRILKRCMALLRDGHTSVDGPSGEPRCSAPAKVRSLQGRAVIVEITPIGEIKNTDLREALSKADLKPGEEVTRIDGHSVKEILERHIYPYISASTPQWRDHIAYPKLLNGEYGTKVKLHIKGLDGIGREVTLIRGRYPRTSQSRGFSCRRLNNDIVYVNLPSFSSEDVVKQFDEVFDKIRSARGLILDLRENGGGNSAFGDAIISYLTDVPLESIRWKTRQYVPAFRAWGEKEEWYHGDLDVIEPRKDGSFVGPIVVLTGPATFSAAEDFVVPLHAGGRATVVGRKTAGSTGQPL